MGGCLQPAAPGGNVVDKDAAQSPRPEAGANGSGDKLAHNADGSGASGADDAVEPEPEDDDRQQVIRPQAAGTSAFSVLASAGLSAVPWKAKDEAPHWVNIAVRRLWPSLARALEAEVLEVAHREIQHNLPDSIKGHVTINRFNLGSAPPEVVDIEVEEIKEGLKVKLSFEFQSGVDVDISVGIAHLGIKKLKVTGAVSAELAPMVGELPVIGAIKVYCPDPPDLDYGFVGLARFADLPLLRTAVRHTIDQVIAHFVVAPNYIMAPLVTGQPPSEPRGRSPCGVLRVRPVRARHLKGSDWAVFSKSTCDAYVQAKVGSDTWNSSVVKNTCNPEWPADDSHDFLVYDEQQVLKLKVFDDDWCNDDDFLGVAEPQEIRDVRATSRRPEALYGKATFLRRGKTVKEDVRDGTVEVEYHWLSMSQSHHTRSEHAHGRDVEGFLLSVELQKLLMPARMARSAQVLLKTHRHKAYSRRVLTPQGNIDVAVKAVDKAVRDIVRKGGEQGLDPGVLAGVTGLKEGVVRQILDKSGDSDKGQPANLSDGRVVAEVPFRHSIFVPVSPADLRTGVATVHILDNHRKVIADVDLKLSEMGSTWPNNGILKLNSKHEENSFALYAKVSVVELKK